MTRNDAFRLVASVGLASLLAACATPKTPAPIVDRPQAQTRPDASRPRPAQQAGPQASPQTVPQTSPQAAQRGYYTVRRGDTLLRIAQEFGQNWRDLVTWNNLSSANDIKVDQVLRVLPPDAPPVAGGAQAGSVAVNPGVEVRPLGNAATPATGSGPVKNGPRGDKRPWSDANLAELQKPEGQPAQAAPQPARDAPKTAEQAATAEDVLDLIWPTEGKVVAQFDQAKKGIDIAGKLGQPVLAAGGGSVLYAGSMRGYGNLVIVKHNNNFLSAYAHNKTILVKEGQMVSRGQKIAEMGNSDTDSVKLHFEIRQQGKPVDPTKFLPSR